MTRTVVYIYRLSIRTFGFEHFIFLKLGHLLLNCFEMVTKILVFVVLLFVIVNRTVNSILYAKVEKTFF
jgi:hypothetical protein